MARSLSTPPFPDSAGAWLACYRYRKLGPKGEHLSPEQLGALLGVSGATVRRWESGSSQPTNQDIGRIAQVCGLEPIEAEFLRLAFDARTDEQPPTWEMFEKSAKELLSTETPSLILDSLFYVRGRNFAASHLSSALDAPELGENLLQPVLSRLCPESPRSSAVESSIQRVLLDVWFSTAIFCGSRPYRRFLADLCRIPGFQERWRAVALQPMQESLAARIQTHQYNVSSPQAGRYRVRQARITFPPLYELHEYIAVDEKAVDQLRGLPDWNTSDICLSPRWHWACEPSEQMSRV